MNFSWKLLGFILFLEILSFLSYANSLAQSILFALVCVSVLLVAYFDFKKGLLVALVELFIGGFGYLFAWSLSGPKISLRLGLFAVLLVIYFLRYFKSRTNTNKPFFGRALFLFIFFILTGVGLALYRQRELNFIYSDVNAFVFLLYLLPFFKFFTSPDDLRIILTVFKTTVAWLSLKIIFTFAFFASDSLSFGGYFYKWIRDTRIGEITEINEGIYRVFFQSAIFLIFYLLLSYSSFLLEGLAKKEKLLPILVWAAILITLSRSFWLGFGLTLFLLAIIIFLFLKIKIKKLFKLSGVLMVNILSAFLLIAALVFFFHPSHNPLVLIKVFEKRIDAAGDAAVSTRMAELPPLWRAIKQNPFWGAGFGTTISFISYDPRIKTAEAGGLYTTYALEWGWFDLILKIGFLGTLSFLNIFWQVF